jgi:hypothetical protein
MLRPNDARPNDGEATAARGSERRRHARFKVAPMYTTLHVRRTADADGPAEFDGHVYDISEGGVRFEIDEPLPEGAVIEVEIGLPGCRRLIEASGKVVRVNAAEDDPGPRRMALMFDRFADPASREALRSYLDQRWLERAA